MSFIFAFFLFSSFLASMTLLLGGRHLGIKGSQWITFFTSVIYVLTLTYFFNIFNHPAGSLIYHFYYGCWFELGEFKVNWGFILDGLSFLMGFLVVTVSTVTQLYSYWYLKEEPTLIRFQAYLQLFTFFMLILVLSDNFALFFLGWEGIGLCSFLLIGFWSSRIEARSAAIKAVGVNRIGDSAFLAAVGILTSLTGSLEFTTNFMLAPFFSPLGVILFSNFSVPVLSLVNFFFLIAICAKSAQLGLHVWLADAMEGPTPVSALIHAATMVTAGIYLVLRCSQLFELTPDVNEIMALVGALTAFFGASVACFQWDIKKIIAYSTCSQLGYMLCACGLGGYTLAFYHLLTHGFFKALLFLASGVLIHQMNGEQDIRKMGGLMPFLPLTFSYFVVGFSALLGLPGTSGFFSKERILDFCSIVDTKVGVICYSFLWLALVCTALYSVKTMHYIFFDVYRGPKKTWIQITSSEHNEVSFIVICSLTVLVSFIFFSEEWLNFYTGAVNGIFLQTSIVTVETNYYLLFAESLASQNRVFPLIAIGLGFWIFWASEVLEVTWARWAFFTAEGSISFIIFRFWQQGWYIDMTLHHIFFSSLTPLICISSIFEKGVFEWLGPSSLDSFFKKAYSYSDSLNNERSVFSSINLIITVYVFILLYVFYILL